MQKIIIEFDTEEKKIYSVSGTENVNPVDVAKILMSVSLSSLNKIEIKEKGKIEVVKPKIIKGMK